ncbi:MULTISPECIES: hypothetical protein [unclassified Flavobacterium]|uniref:hypothetical protein n=1 Tax=unclassified Flavobacterium TaxID=196869 RepID=UPI0006AB7E46|nr:MULTISPECIES: hypothetical protein [unclassified Flavobacterium]KOP38879.1 hypothetical protein AKO67_07610 [Flavobacterium sp. VMW]OWU92830.1 hypothetical protein APR43_01875 [Flavobacterium sp. NLM]
MNFEENDINHQRKIIGEFFLQFDTVISTIPFNIPRIIYKKDHTELEKRNIETLLCAMTASTLKISYDSLIFDNYKELPELVKANKEISKIVDKVTEIRNSFAHGSYRLGWKDFDGNIDKDYFSLRHSKATKSGYEKRSWIYKISQVELLIKQLQNINNAYLLMNTIVFLHSQEQEIDSHIANLTESIPKIGKIEFKPIMELK